MASTGLFKRPVDTTKQTLECGHRMPVEPGRPSAWCTICLVQVSVAG